MLVCSDGLSGQVPRRAIAELIEAPASLDAAASRLVDEANGAGGLDNVSVVLARLA